MPRANIVARSTVKPGRMAEAVELGSRVADLLVESGAQSSRFWVPVFNPVSYKHLRAHETDS